MKRFLAAAIFAVAVIAIAQQSAQAGGRTTVVADQGPTYVQATHPGSY